MVLEYEEFSVKYGEFSVSIPHCYLLILLFKMPTTFYLAFCTSWLKKINKQYTLDQSIEQETRTT